MKEFGKMKEFEIFDVFWIFTFLLVGPAKSDCRRFGREVELRDSEDLKYEMRKESMMGDLNELLEYISK